MIEHKIDEAGSVYEDNGLYAYASPPYPTDIEKIQHFFNNTTPPKSRLVKHHPVRNQWMMDGELVPDISTLSEEELFQQQTVIDVEFVDIAQKHIKQIKESNK
ncbi:hypothetical protein ACWKVY_000352 [Klebsiella pneumoniae]